MFQLYKGGRATRLSEGAGHVIVEGIEVPQTIRDYGINQRATIDMTSNDEQTNQRAQVRQLASE